MTKALKRKKSKGTVITELQVLVEQARTLIERAVPDEWILADCMVSRLEWNLHVNELLPHMKRGIQVAADFNRATEPGHVTLCHSLTEEQEHFRRLLGNQTDVLAKALERWKNSNTSPLD